uniref:Putative secreted protein n=1 Tax=Anopheles darlingi TaxID=43151 RepID=A0A2M4DPJ5_ANODA
MVWELISKLNLLLISIPDANASLVEYHLIMRSILGEVFQRRTGRKAVSTVSFAFYGLLNEKLLIYLCYKLH